MLASIFSQLTGRPLSLNLITYHDRRYGIPFILFTHDVVELSGGQRAFSPDKRGFSDRRVLLLVRDPRDVLVSLFFHTHRRARKRSSVQEAELEDFIRGPRGIVRTIDFFNSWAANLTVPAQLMILRYEDLRRDTTEALRACLEFLQIAGVDDRIVTAAVEAGALEKMRQVEAQHLLTNYQLRPGNRSDPESFKVRRGKVGGYVDYLTDQQISYVDEQIRTRLSPVFAEYIR